ncbi:MAG TPA: Crp/Fnr family transcriptional regulator [Chthonomonadaceae bacterium]|nr:Crp/Fnr family transcriptional regulator [Chthonomonadaceae bacterium]
MTLDVAYLRSIPLFEDLPADQLAAIAAHCRQRTYRAEEAIIHEKDPGESLYVIVQGTVKVSKTQPDGNAVFLAILAAGDTFGEMSLIDSMNRSADVATLEETTLVAIDRPDFEHLVNTVPTFTRNMLRTLARRLRLANACIEALCTLDVEQRIARQIIAFAENYGRTLANGDRLIPVRLTQGTLAEIVGASRERVNQVMVYYRRKGYISVGSNYHITVHNAEELQMRMH